jgi:Ca2+-transporting ATPase
VLILGSIVFGLPIFILPVQILWENLIEGSPQGIAIAFEPEEADIMKRKPESSKTPLFSPLMKDIIFKFGIITDIILFFIAWALYRNGMPIEEVRTFCFVGLAISSLFYGFSCKNFKKNLWQYNPFNNKWLNLSILFGWVMIILAVYNPVLQLLLKTVPLPVFDWILLMGLGIFQISIIEAVKWWHIKKYQHKI